jgi:gluconolactonase
MGELVRYSIELDSVMPADGKIEVLAEGFDWTEGPLWVKDGSYLLFTDIPPNKIMKWQEGAGVSVYLTPSGTADPNTKSKEPGANGLLLDALGNLVLCQHGDRRVVRMNTPLNQPKPEFTSLADRFNGKRLNSPNDACFDKKGNLYFTDPPYGLPTQDETDPAKELKFQGVYRLSPNGKLDLLIDSLSRPNGIALSPDEKTLYVANSDPKRAIWIKYDLSENGKLANGKVFYDATEMTGRYNGLPDGMKVHRTGAIFATGPGGVWVFNKNGIPIGQINTGQATSNCAIGNDGKYLYMTADAYLLRIRIY